MKKIMIFFLCLLASFNLSAEENMLKVNSDFELGIKKGWFWSTADGQMVSFTKDAAKNGKFGLKLSPGDAKLTIFSQPNDGNTFKIENGMKYILEFMVKTISKGNGLELVVYPITGLKDVFCKKHYKGDLLMLNEWSKLTFEFEGKDIPEAKFYLFVNKGEYLMDDFNLHVLK
jgi:hypothetical protein